MLDNLQKDNFNLTPSRKLYLEYWTALKSSFEGGYSGIKFQKPQPQCWMGFAIGRTDFHHTKQSRSVEEDLQLAEEATA